MKPPAPCAPCRQLPGWKCESYDGQQLTCAASRIDLGSTLAEVRSPRICTLSSSHQIADTGQFVELFQAFISNTPKTHWHSRFSQMEDDFQRRHVQMIALGIAQLSPCSMLGGTLGTGLFLKSTSGPNKTLATYYTGLAFMSTGLMVTILPCPI
jgi:hypothetical protein